MANNHSFYTEAKKSLEASESFSWRKILKGFRKYSKWGIYVFLTITTLWGCVNQFRHNTSQYVSQGIEFYQSHDEVLPNLYWGVQTPLTYQVVGEENVTHQDQDGNIDGTGVQYNLKPLEFYSINPFYGSTSENLGENVNTTDKIIRNSELTDSNGNSNPGSYSYNMSYYAAMVSILNYDWEEYLSSDRI